MKKIIFIILLACCQIAVFAQQAAKTFTVSGTVVAVDATPDTGGTRRPSLSIRAEGDVWIDTIDRSDRLVKTCDLSKEEIFKKITEAGLVGMGGATFPTHVKLAVPAGKTAEMLIINGVECEPFLTAGSVPRFVAFVESGVFRYTCLDGRGNEHVVGYAFPDEYVCDYRSFICGTAAVVDIRAVAESVSYLLPCTELERYWESGIEGQRLGRRVAEELFAITYDRLLDFYCKTPEEHYLNLIDRYPGLVDVIPLKELASFIGVTPETVSHIRRKLSSKRKS